MYFLQTISVHHYSVTSRTGLLGRRLSNHNGDIHSFGFQVFNGCIVEPWILLARLQKNLRIFCFQITGSLDNLLWSARVRVVTIGSLSKDVFERRTSTGSEAFSLFICLDTTKFVLLSFFSPMKTIYLRVSTKPQPNAAKSQLPVDVRRSKTLLLKLPIVRKTNQSAEFLWGYQGFKG